MIRRFYVEKLFNLFDNEIKFKIEEKITILVGNNGCGKTTMLNMLKAIFSSNHSVLLDYEFKYIELELENSLIKIEKSEMEIGDNEDEKNYIRCLKYYLNDKELEQVYRENNKLNSPAFWQRLIPSLRRISADLFRDMKTSKILKREELFDEYFDEIPDNIKNELIPIPNEINDLLRDVEIIFITTERLKTTISESDWRGETNLINTVEIYSNELRSNIVNALSNYANLSQKLDEKFPFRVLEAIKKKKGLSTTELRNSFEKIQELRNKHILTGVLENSENRYFNSDLDGVDENTASVLTVYYNDTEEKLHALDDISDRILLFLNIINDKLGKYKHIRVSANEGIEFTQENQENNKKSMLKLSSLSSGEQQEIVLLYQLIFTESRNKIILIDEPEISLNVNWQREFIQDIKKIIEVNGFNVLIATHSPQIINNNWNLVVSLGEVD